MGPNCHPSKAIFPLTPLEFSTQALNVANSYFIAFFGFLCRAIQQFYFFSYSVYQICYMGFTRVSYKPYSIFCRCPLFFQLQARSCVFLIIVCFIINSFRLGLAFCNILCKNKPTALYKMFYAFGKNSEKYYIYLTFLQLSQRFEDVIVVSFLSVIPYGLFFLLSFNSFYYQTTSKPSHSQLSFSKLTIPKSSYINATRKTFNNLSRDLNKG